MKFYLKFFFLGHICVFKDFLKFCFQLFLLLSFSTLHKRFHSFLDNHLFIHSFFDSSFYPTILSFINSFMMSFLYLFYPFIHTSFHPYFLSSFHSLIFSFNVSFSFVTFRTGLSTKTTVRNLLCCCQLAFVFFAKYFSLLTTKNETSEKNLLLHLCFLSAVILHLLFLSALLLHLWFLSALLLHL